MRKILAGLACVVALGTTAWPQTPTTLSLISGWNPVGFQVTTVTALNATGVTGMAYYTQGQSQTAAFTAAEVNAGAGPRRGVWVYSPSGGSVTYAGTVATPVGLNLTTGWNMVSFCTSTSLGLSDFTVQQNGATVPLQSVVLPQFQEIQPNRTYQSVDLLNGGRLTPGRATWVYSLAPVTLTVSGAGTSPTPTPTPGDMARVAGLFGSAVQVTVGSTDITLASQSQPDHVSAYWPTSNPLYQAYTAPGFRPNPGTIGAIPVTVRIPRFPQPASTKTATPLGPIGLSRNGVPFYNQYAAGYQPLTMELAGMDQGNGHPNPMDQYHYHLPPTLVMAGANVGTSGFLGVLTDGYPVYGTTENGRTITNADLDVYHGHTAATAEFPEGIYHYHVTAADPYINGGSFYGVPGTAR